MPISWYITLFYFNYQHPEEDTSCPSILPYNLSHPLYSSGKVGLSATFLLGMNVYCSGFLPIASFWNHMKLFLPKEIYTEFQHLNHEIGQLLKEAYSLRENVERLPGNDRDTEIKGKLASLHSKLNEYSKQARTRETLSSALISEEEQLRTKLAAMEEEQVCFNISCICVSRQLN